MNLQKFGVQELSVQEQKEMQGGWLFNFISIGSNGFYLFGFRIF